MAIVQIPIIGKYKRRLTVREAARLQDFPENFIPNDNDQQAYKQFGNAVNVEVVKICAEKLFDYDDTKVNVDEGAHLTTQSILMKLSYIINYHKF